MSPPVFQLCTQLWHSNITIPLCSYLTCEKVFKILLKGKETPLCILMCPERIYRVVIKKSGILEFGRPRFYPWIAHLLAVWRRLPWWLSGKESACPCGRRGFDPWVQDNRLEKEMAAYSSILPWEIPWTEEPGGLQFMGL